MNERFYKVNAILKDYLRQSHTILPHFEQKLRPDWNMLAKQLASQFNGSIFIGELVAQNASAEYPEIQKTLDRLEKDKVLIVITGQQLGLLISPLYTVYKILTTIKLARQLSAGIDAYQVIPVFWLEGEDHDFEEVNRLHYWDSDGRVLKAGLEDTHNGENRSISRRIYGEGIKKLMEEIQQSLPDTEYKSTFIQAMVSSFRPESGWIDGFRKHLLEIFGRFGLLTYDPTTFTVKKKSRPFFKRVISENPMLRKEFSKTSDELVRKGYFNQVTVLDDRSYLFLNYENRNRQPVLIKNDGFYIQQPQKNFSVDELEELIERNPEWISSSALTRPLWQSWMLPVISYVAGPGEIAYWAQLKSAFNALDLVMPHLKPRLSCTLIEPRIDRLLKKYTILPEEIKEDRARFIKIHMADAFFKETGQRFDGLSALLTEKESLIQESAAEIDPTLQSVVSKTFSSMEHNLDKLRNRLLKRVQEKEELMRRHLEAIYDALLPEGHPQERYISSVNFQNRYGPEWIDLLYEMTDLQRDEHQLIRL